MKKRITIGLLAAVFALSSVLAGCSSSGSSSSSAASSASSGSAEAVEGVSGESMTLIMSSRDEFLSTLEEGALAAAGDFGINLTVQDADNDQSKLLQFVETAKNNGEKAVIVNLVDADAAEAIVEAAGDMYVVFVNRLPNDTSLLSEKVVYAGSNELQSGGLQGEYLAEYFSEQGKTEISYILIKGTEGQDATTKRTNSALDGLEENGITATEATAPLVADWDRATAQDMISPLISAGLDYDCIISNNDAMALGAIEALTAANIDATEIPIVGVDATVDGCQAIEAGTLNMSAFQNGPGQGLACVTIAANLILGNDLTEGLDYEIDDTGVSDYIVWVPFEKVTAENVADYL